MPEHRYFVPGARARVRRAVRHYAASVVTAELPEGELVVVDSVAWSGGCLHVAVVVPVGERRGQVAIVQAGELVLVLDEEADG